MARTVSLGSIRIGKTKRTSFNPFRTITIRGTKSRKTLSLKLRRKKI